MPDPAEAIRKAAGKYAGVDEGKACTQTSFKSARKAFLYVGMAKGRYKAMFCLNSSLPDAARRAAKDPGRFEVGKMGWVTARFTEEEPMPKALWQKWLDESYRISVAGSGDGSSSRVVRKK